MAAVLLIAGAILSLGAAVPDGLDQQALLAREPGAWRLDKPVWSPDARRLALAGENGNGLYVYDLADRSCLRITDSPSSGYACRWSHDGRRLGLKLLVPGSDPNAFAQIPAVFDVERKALTPLNEAVPRAGVPSFAADGRVAFTIDEDLRIADDTGRQLATFPLGHYANLTPISPDGTKAAYNDRDDLIWVIDLATGQKTCLAADVGACFNPVWSPDSARLAVSTLTGRLKTINLATAQVWDLDEGAGPSWSPDGQTVFYAKTDRIDGVGVLDAAVYAIRYDASDKTRLTARKDEYATAGCVSPDGKQMAFVSLQTGEIHQAPLIHEPTQEAPGSRRYRLGAREKLLGGAPAPQIDEAAGLDATATLQPVAATSGYQLLADVVVTGTVPYLHQVYDTPDDFNGHWACGASSALMAINYYNILPYWDIVCSTPYSHVSHYGQYVSRIYTFNGHTYNIGSPDPNGVIAYGGYGYIVRNDWADTKSYMRDYIINHGLGSSVDWSPSWSKLQTEVANNNPFVLLNSLTTAGHYITTIGYVSGQYTGIFNDPYGNKNNPGGYVNYYGAGAKYDWPGYNNGYDNLNTVWCFIYCRGALNQPPVFTLQPTSQNVCPGATATFNALAVGGTVTYQWQKNEVNLTNGGHYAGCTTSTLTVSNCDAGDVASYRCVATNTYGSTNSNSAALALKTITSITQHPLAQQVSLGGTATFNVTAAGSGTLSYQWRKNSVNLTNSTRISGVNTATLQITSVGWVDVAAYSCAVSADCGSAESNTASLSVTNIPGDFDADNDVDLQEFGLLQKCLGTLNAVMDTMCSPTDLSGDDVVGYDDVSLFKGCMSGPEVPASVNCAQP